LDQSRHTVLSAFRCAEKYGQDQGGTHIITYELVQTAIYSDWSATAMDGIYRRYSVSADAYHWRAML